MGWGILIALLTDPPLEQEVEVPHPELSDIPGIGPVAARRLKDSGFADLNSLVDARPEALARVHGFSLSRATEVIAAAQALAAAQPLGLESTASSSSRESRPQPDRVTDAPTTRRDKKKKKKRKKKDKKRGKRGKQDRKKKKKKKQGKGKDKGGKHRKHKKKREK